MTTNFGLLKLNSGLCLCAKFHLDRFILSHSGGRKLQVLQLFGRRRFVVSPIGGLLNAGAQLQTFPYPTVSKSFLYFNAFMAKVCTRSLSFKSVTDTQTNQDTNQKTKLF